MAQREKSVADHLVPSAVLADVSALIVPLFAVTGRVTAQTG